MKKKIPRNPARSGGKTGREKGRVTDGAGNGKRGQGGWLDGGDNSRGERQANGQGRTVRVTGVTGGRQRGQQAYSDLRKDYLGKRSLVKCRES